MNDIKIFRVFGILTLISLYFLILVGGVVRATGSGMGCPDWPKCFGHFVPPSDISEVSFKSNYEYAKRVFIIHEHKLYYSKKGFVSNTDFVPSDWELFEDHGYAEFNPTHTWIEAFNRYIGVFVGLFVLGLFTFSVLLFRKNMGVVSEYDFKKIMYYSLLALIFVIIQGIIGKYLVASNLKLKMLTIHMLFSYTVLFATIYVLYNTSTNYLKVSFNQNILNLIVISLLLTAIQTILGTQVTVNAEVLMRGDVERASILQHFGVWFYIHRSFSILLLGFNGFLVFRVLKIEDNAYVKILAISSVLILVLEAFVGILLNYFDYPKFAQPIHLLLGTMIAGLQLYLYIIYKKQKEVQFQ